MHQTKQLLSSPICYWMTNQEISQYAYVNSPQKRAYFSKIRSVYRSLFTDILKPTPLIESKMASVCGSHTDIVGIQIRCGDRFMVTNMGESHSTGIAPNIDRYLRRISNTIATTDYVFVTSDYDKAFPIAKSIFGPDRVLYLNEPIQHLDR